MTSVEDLFTNEGKDPLLREQKMNLMHFCHTTGWINVQQNIKDEFINNKEVSTCVLNADSYLTGLKFIPLNVRPKIIPEVWLKQRFFNGDMSGVNPANKYEINDHNLVVFRFIVARISAKKALFGTVSMFQHQKDIQAAAPEYTALIAQQTKQTRDALNYKRRMNDDLWKKNNAKRANKDMGEDNPEDNTVVVAADKEEEEEEEKIELPVDRIDPHRVLLTRSIILNHFFSFAELPLKEKKNYLTFFK